MWYCRRGTGGAKLEAWTWPMISLEWDEFQDRLLILRHWNVTLRNFSDFISDTTLASACVHIWRFSFKKKNNVSLQNLKKTIIGNIKLVLINRNKYYNKNKLKWSRELNWKNKKENWALKVFFVIWFKKRKMWISVKIFI